MSDDDEPADQGDRLERADRIRSRREGRSGSSRRPAAGEEDAQTAQSDGGEQPSQTSQTSQSSMSSQSDQRAQKQPVKDRPHRTIYLPEQLDDDFETAIDTLLFEAKTQHGVKLGKNRHAYPLLVHLGLQRAEEMDVEALLDLLDTEDALDDAPARE